MTALTIEVPRALLISANDRMHWREKARRTAVLRTLGWATTCGQTQGGFVRGHDRCTLTVTVTYPPLARRRDAANLAPTIKALLDGCVDAGLLPDDNDTRITATTYRASADKGVVGAWRRSPEFTEDAHGTTDAEAARHVAASKHGTVTVGKP